MQVRMLLYCLVLKLRDSNMLLPTGKPISVSKLSPIAEGRRNYNAYKRSMLVLGCWIVCGLRLVLLEHVRAGEVDLICFETYVVVRMVAPRSAIWNQGISRVIKLSVALQIAAEDRIEP